MDKARLKMFLVWVVCLILIGSSLYFGFIKRSLAVLLDSGFEPNNLYFLLIIPFIGLFMSFWKIILGFNVVNSFIPILIIFSCFVSGPLFTLIILLYALVIGFIAKYTISDLRIHFAVKLSIILTVLSLGMLLLFQYFEQYSTTRPLNDHFLITYGILVISLINEKYFAFKISKINTFTTIKNAFATMIFSYLAFLLLGGVFNFWGYVVKFSYIKELLQTYPDLIFLELFLLILIGQYTGLRLTEVFRFRKLLFK